MPETSDIGYPDVEEKFLTQVSELQALRSRSPQIGQLVAALAAAQSKYEPLFKETSNPFFKSKYADLSQVIAATRKPLADNGLVIIQTPIVREKNAGVVSILAHKSGEWIQDELLLPAGVSKFDAQTIGSAITYARRYSYQALIGVAAEVDDDANHASGNNGSKEAAQAVLQRKIAEAKSSATAAEGASAQGKSSLALKKVHFDNRGDWTYLTGDGLGTLLHFLGLPAEEGGIYQFKEKFMAADKDDQGFPTNWRVKSNKAELLAEAAVSYGLDAKQSPKANVPATPSSTKGNSPKTASAPSTTSGTPKRAILAEGRLAGTLDGAEIRKKKQKQGDYLYVTVGEYTASLWDNMELSLDGKKVRAFEELQRSLHQPVEFLVKPNGQHLNVVRILRLGCFEWDTDGVPVIQRGPVNPDITDGDLGI